MVSFKQHRHQLRDHLYVQSSKTKSPQSQICRGFPTTWDFLALSPRHPLTRADTSTHPHSPPPQMSPKQLLLQLQAGDVETNSGPAPRCGVCRKSTTAKAVICCSCLKSIQQSCSGMTRTMQRQWHQTNDHQCPNCRSVHNCQILCSKCGKGLRLNHNRETSGVCDATAHLECTDLSCRQREGLKQGVRSWSCCNLLAMMIMSNSDLLHPLHLPEMWSWVPQSDQEINSEGNLYQLWSNPTPGLHPSAKMREKKYL